MWVSSRLTGMDAEEALRRMLDGDSPRVESMSTMQNRLKMIELMLLARHHDKMESRTKLLLAAVQDIDDRMLHLEDISKEAAELRKSVQLLDATIHNSLQRLTNP